MRQNTNPSRRAPRKAASFGLLTLLLTAATLTVPTGAQQQATPRRDLPNYDIRLDAKAAGDFLQKTGTVASLRGDAVAARIAAVAGLQREFAGLQVVPSEALHVAESVGRAAGAGFLTAPSTDRSTALRAFLQQHADAFGTTEDAVQTLELVADYQNPGGGMAWVEFEQKVNGLPVFQGYVRGGFTAKGELVRTTGLLVPGATASSRPGFDAASAVSMAAASVGWSVPAGLAEQLVSDDGKVTLARGNMADNPRAWLAYFPLSGGALRLSWVTELWGDPDVYMVVLDAETGTPLFRKNLTNYQTQAATYNVYNNDSPAPASPSPAVPGANYQAPYIARTNRTLVGNEGNRSFNNLGWITDNTNGANGFTDGNNVQAGLDIDGANGVDAPVNGTSRVFSFAYDPSVDAPTSPNYRSGEVTDMFYWTNEYHDRLYLLGFTELARNFQDNNFGRGGAAADRISAEAQDSSGTSNANFATPADGGRGRMQMYVFPGPTPTQNARTSGIDHDVLLHELTHGTSNRLHANGSGLTAAMAGGMGEGWSDFYARALLADATEPVDGVFTTGGWITYKCCSANGTFSDNYYYGIRRFPYAVKSAVGPNGKPHNPLTFADIDATKMDLTDGAYPKSSLIGGSALEVHNAGEVWATALWEVHGRLVTRLGFAAGNQKALQFVTDGMKLDPVNPTFLDARDSIIAAATASGTAADVADVWRGFALRGMGTLASIQNANTGAVTESFLAPGDPTPTLTINDVAATEGNAGTKTFTFTVTLTNPSSATATVNWATAAGTATAAGITSTVSSGAVTINDNAAASVYPVAFNVSGVTGTIQSVAVRLNGISHTFPADIDALLVGPGGQKSMFMSDVGGGADLVGATLTFRDGFPAASGAALISGTTYGPTDLDTASDAMPSPAPAGPYTSAFSVFSGLNPNGTWNIYLRDDAAVDVGALTSIDLLVTVPSSNADYADGSGTLTFPSGTTTQAINVTVNGDTVPEPNETFFVNLTNPINAVIGDAQGVGTIVNDENGVPFTVNDSYSVAAGSTLSVAAPGVLGNDVEASAPMTAAPVTNPAHGSVTLNGNGSFIYTPTAGYAGADSFTYRASNTFGPGNTSTVSITVNPGAPTTNNDSYGASYMTALSVAAPGVLANDVANGSAITSALLVSPAANGTLSLAGNGGFTYTPNEDFAGTDTFTYRAVNGVGQGTTGTVSIGVAQPTETQKPKQLYVSSVVGNRVTLRWKAPVVGPTPTGYVLEGGIAPGQTLAAIPTGLDAPIFTFDAPSGSFFVRMKTVGSGGTSVASNEVPLHVNVPVPPSAPEGLVAGAGGNALNLVWRNTFGGGPATGMTLDVSGTVTASLPMGLTDTFSVPFVPDGTYTFAVRQTNGAGSSPASTPLTLSFPVSAPGFPSGCNAAPQAPINFLAYRAGNTVNIVWDPAGTGAAPSGYVLNVTSAVFTGSVPMSGRSFSSPAPSGSYTFTLQAANGCGASTPTAAQVVVIP